MRFYRLASPGRHTYAEQARFQLVTRPRHPVKELEAVLDEAESKNWRVTKGKRYFKLWCPGECKCWKTVHLSPSGARYELNLRHKLSRDTCWDKKDDQEEDPE
jgi:hypothetical protein